MKKILFLLLSAAVAASAVAGVNLPAKRVGQDKSRGIPLVDKNVYKDVKEKRRSVDDRMTAPPMKQAFNATDDSRPEGHLKRYTRSGKVVFLDNAHYYSADQSDTIDIVFALDGSTVYLKNILMGSGLKYGDYWVQGVLSTDGTKLPCPWGSGFINKPRQTSILCWHGEHRHTFPMV